MMKKTLTERISALRKAVIDPGISPSTHYQIMSQHRDEWPVLWAAIDALIATEEPQESATLWGFITYEPKSEYIAVHGPYVSSKAAEKEMHYYTSGTDGMHYTTRLVQFTPVVVGISCSEE